MGNEDQDTTEIEADAEAIARIRAARTDVANGDVLTAEELVALITSRRKERGARGC